jgi:hypothetical protein
MWSDTEVISSIDEITEEEGKFLVQLAKAAIEYYLKTGKVITLKEFPYPILKKKGATFVTLTKKKSGELRGCIGSIIPIRPLYEDVINNAIAAATKDPRFFPVTIEELPEIDVKVSVLSYPEKIEYTDYIDLLNKIEPFKDGLIIKFGNAQATFLPDVWEELPNKEEFLSHLCLKAGLPADFWKTGKLEVFRYRTKVF